jgi:hypothetical protein
VITAQPASQNVCTNASTSLSVAANYGSTYQWSLGGTALPGANSSSYFIASAAILAAGNYTATVTNPAGSVTGSAISGATSTSYTVPSSITNNINDQDQYYVLVTNSYGQAVSQNAPLVVGNGVMIQITDQPGTVYVNAGAPSTFSVTATSTLSLSYQWYKAAPGSSTFTPISGATSSTYTLASPAVSDTGSVYHVIVSNGATSPVTSSSASLFVGALASIPSCSASWSMLGTTITSGSCGYQLTAATTGQFGEIVWPTLISTGNIRLAFTIATSNPSSPPADGFAMVLGDPSLGATLTSQAKSAKVALTKKAHG